MKTLKTASMILLSGFAALALVACGDSSSSNDPVGPGLSSQTPGSSNSGGNGGNEGGSQGGEGGSSQSGGSTTPTPSGYLYGTYPASTSTDLGPNYNSAVPTTATPRYALTDADFAPGSGNGAVPETGDCGSETGDISPANGCMRYIGRVYNNTANGTVDYNWPGIVTMARFKGTSVTVKFRIEDSMDGNMWLDAYIDGKKVVRYPVSSPATESATDGQTVIYNHGSLRLWKDSVEYLLARNLDDGEHDLVLAKRSESNFAAVHFAGLKLDAGKGLSRIPTARSERRIEVIGDSYSVGYGDEYPTANLVNETRPYVQASSGGACSDEQFHAYTNSGAAYAHALASVLGAEVHLNAYSGLGMERNYNGNTAYNSFPGYYGRVLQHDETVKYDPNVWHPQLMVIMLGTNDYSMLLNGGEIYADDAALNAAYRASYHAFLHKQRELHPGIKFIVGGTPLDINVAGNKQMDQAQLVIDEERAAGNNDVVFFKFANLSGYGCAWHPGWKLQKDWARQIANVVLNDSEGILNLNWSATNAERLPWAGAEHYWYGDDNVLALN